MKKLNYFSPLPPLKSGISDYSEELLRELQKYFDITAYVDKNYIPKKQKNIKLENYKNFDNKNLNIYNIGNSEEHAYIYYSLIKTSGITILHDEELEGLAYPMEININKKLSKNGWHQLEEEGGIKFRWTKKKAFLNIGEEITELILEVYTEYPATLTIYINKIKNKFRLNQNNFKKIKIKINSENRPKIKLKISKPLGFLSQIRDPHFRSMGIKIYSIQYKTKKEYKKLDLESKIIKNLNKKIVSSSKGVIVHSEHLKDYVKKINPKIPVKIIKQGVDILKPKISRQEMKEKLKLENYDFVLCSFGKIQRHKRIEQGLIAFSKFIKKFPNSIYIIIGKEDETFNLQKVIKKYNLENKTIIKGYIDFEKVIEYIYSSDICMNLRGPTTGATSNSLIKSLSIGTPCIITDLPENKEFPNSCVFKVKISENEIKQIGQILEYIKNNPKKQKEMAENTLKYIQENHLWENQAIKIKKFIEEIYKNENSNNQSI